jgi:hypothetical protein
VIRDSAARPSRRLPCVLQGDEEAEDLGSGEHGQNKERERHREWGVDVENWIRVLRWRAEGWRAQEAEGKSRDGELQVPCRRKRRG